MDVGRKIVVVNFPHRAVERENEMKVPATLLDGLLTFGSAPPRGHVIEIDSAEAQIGGCRRPFGVAILPPARMAMVVGTRARVPSRRKRKSARVLGSTTGHPSK